MLGVPEVPAVRRAAMDAPNPGPDPNPATPQDPAAAQDPATPQDPSAAPVLAGDGPEVSGSPYRNLWVPLVVVPFLVVGVLVLVFVFFGAIGGTESGIEDNLTRVVHGGANERKQAAVSLAAQVVENHRAKLQGRKAPWPVGEDFRASLDEAWQQTLQDDNHRIRLAIAQLSAHYGDPGALEKLSTFLELSGDEDGDASLRVQAMLAMAWLRDPAAAPHLVPFLSHEDAYLRQAAASALQTAQSPVAVEALRGVLGDGALELRGMAAISLSHLGDASGASVLRDLVDPATYEAVREEDPAKYASDRLVQQSRLLAVQALARLDLDQDTALFERLAADEADLAVREAAMIALQGPDSAQN